MSIEDLDSKLKERLEQVHWSFYLYNRSLAELHMLTYESYNEEELKIVNSSTFNFYKVTLQYCFIMEYCKLLENKKKARGSANISSIHRLNESFYGEFGESFGDTYKKNNQHIEQLQVSPYHQKIRSLRDKKFAHSDTNFKNTPYEFKGFTESEIEEGFKHLRVIKSVINSLTFPYDFQYLLEIPYRDKRTRNFVKYHVDYKDYYYRNFLKRNKN